MRAEYFPPKEDVILQNEAPTDFYILVSGAVVILISSFSPCIIALYFENSTLYSDIVFLN